MGIFKSWMEAKDFLRTGYENKDTPSQKINIMGWNVYMRDKGKAEYSKDFENHNRKSQKINQKKQEIETFLNSQSKAQQAISETLNVWKKNILESNFQSQYRDPEAESRVALQQAIKNNTPLNTSEEQIRSTIQNWSSQMLESVVSKMSGLRLHSLELKSSYQQPVPVGNINIWDFLSKSLFGSIKQMLNEAKSILPRLSPEKEPQNKIKYNFEEMIKKVTPAIEQAITRLKAIGLSKSVRVPINVNFDNEYPNSGYGTSKAAGTASAGGIREPYAGGKTRNGTHYVTINVKPDTNPDNVIKTFVHEIGHIIFSTLSAEQQKEIENMANKTQSPSNYGRTNYVYSGLKEPSKNHKSGNEWFAEMLALVVANPNGNQKSGFFKRLLGKIGLADVDPTYSNQDVSKLKKFVSGVKTSPHHAISYKNKEYQDD